MQQNSRRKDMSHARRDKCAWHMDRSPDRCDRPVFGESEYCLFHKPDKTKEEDDLFWKVINYNPYAGFTREEIRRAAELVRLYHEDPVRFARCAPDLDRKREQAKVLNFTESERAQAGFAATATRIEELFKQSKTRPWADNMDYRGFVFSDPIGRDRVFAAFNFPLEHRRGPMARYDFSYARFVGRVFFLQHQFVARVDFRCASFSQSVVFCECIFSGPTFFIGTDALRTNIMGRHLFERCSFLGDHVVFEDLNALDLRGASFSRDTRLDVRDVLPKRPELASDVYRRAQEQAVVTGRSDEARAYQYQSLECHRRGLLKEEMSAIGSDFRYALKKPSHIREALKTLWGYRSEVRQYLLGTVAKWTTGYLLRPWRVVGTMLFVILVMSVLYPFAGVGYTDGEGIRQTVEVSWGGWGSSLYFSVVTLTTLGYGDFSPATVLARVLCNVESFLGIILAGLLVVSLSKHVLRE
jgi:hypothetical protein